MKLNRNSKKWVELYNQRLAEILKENPCARYQFETYTCVWMGHIKEAEEYADRLFSAMR